MGSHALGINASGGAPAYNAQQFRQSVSALTTPGASGLQAIPGARPGTGLAVSVAGSTITVTPGSAVVQGASSTVQGPYLAALDANWTQALTAADGTNPRIDLVYLRVRDTDADGSGQRDCIPVYVAGTPAASPTAPTIPAGTTGIVLATISVPKSGAGSPTVSTAARQITVASGGILPTPTAPANPYVGQYWDDGTQLRRWNGTVWETYGPVPQWQNWTPSWTGLSNLGSSISKGRVWKHGTRVEMIALLNWGTGGSLGTNSIGVSLPYPVASFTDALGWQGEGKFRESVSGLWHPMHCNIEAGATVCQVNAIRGSDMGLVSPGSQGYNWGATTALMRAHIVYESAS
ncbi:hypothetical protein ABZ330_21840 [Streptomyces sp. NPDC006172]|uniref:hypothetical protein n=1 Tax=Streptomyces sp. NPDC006172 TaxID=3154470 RepID=UPI0033D10DF8